MKRILFSLIFCTFALSETILIPEDFSTIQEGIDASVDGDTVLVADGDYVENLVLDKSIVLTSYAIYDNLDEWIIFDDYFFNQWVINNSHIENTRLIGSSPDDPDYGSVILITPDSEECISPEIVGFTIQGGSGTNVVRNIEGEDVNVVLGGGILADVSDPHIHHNAFDNNNNENIYSGGAMQLTSSAEDWSFNDRLEDYDIECNGFEEFRLSHNLYNGNDAQYGNTMANRFHEDEFDMSGSIFDVFDCGNEENEVSSVWVKVEPVASVEYADGVGQLCAFTASDVYVDPSILQECLDEGCGFSNNPFKTITRTLEMINPTEDNPITIHLAAGTYSPETGEDFPINMLSNVNIEGEDEETTILDAMQTSRIITMVNCDNNTIAGITITGGLAEGEFPDNHGGGMYLTASHPILTHVTISNNTANAGGGMRLGSSNPTLTHVTITGNTGEASGGGMYLTASHPILTHVTISNNTAQTGGGMLLFSSNPTLTDVSISGNTAVEGGGMYLFSSNPVLTHVTISNNTAEYGGGMRLASSNLVLTNSIIWDNSPQSIFSLGTGTGAFITYSDIEGGWEGEGNIDADPLFVDPENGDYSLQEGSVCIDTGHPNLWYQDQDGTVSDMGATGGSSILPNFISHDFGEVGDIGSSKQFTLYNYRETSITISSVSFGTASFTTSTYFPITIEPLETGIINLDINNSTTGTVNDNMEIISVELPQGLSVELSATVVGGNILTGNLSGVYDVAEYRISGDLTIGDGDTAYLNAGTEFLFDGGVNFNIYGTLKAIGSESDSIIFDNYSDERWSGFTLENASDATTFEYVRISGAEKVFGGGMFLTSSNPTLTHVTTSGNTAVEGGGMLLDASNPTLTHVSITGNTGEATGGGMYLYSSNPTLTHVSITGNTGDWSGGMYLSYSNPTLTHVTITGNTADWGGGGIRLSSSHPILTNSILWNNSPESIDISSGTPVITYSDIEGGWEGEENIDADPLFTNPENGDYSLQEDSPCIDSGTADIDGDGVDDITDYIGSAPDMGAYEFGQSSEIMAGDTNFDGIVDILDIVRIINQIMGNSDFNDDEFIAADFNADGIVDILDIVQIVNYILAN